MQTGATCEASTGKEENNRKATTAKRLGGPQVPAGAAKAHRGSAGCRSWARTKASELIGTPSTTNPCASERREPAPTQLRLVGDGGHRPAAFHTCLSLVGLDVAVLSAQPGRLALPAQEL